MGSTSLPLATLCRFDIGNSEVTKWRSFVELQDSEANTEEHVVVLPRRFSAVTTNGSALRSKNLSECRSDLEHFVQAVEKNHLYMEQSFQASYTSAFFFLFQNAVHHKRLSATATVTLSPSEKAPPLAFAGNVQTLNVHVSLPITNALISLVGCVLMLLLSIGIVVHAKQSEEALQQRASADVAAEAVMNTPKFPPSLLALALEQTATTITGSVSDAQQVRVAVQALCVQSIVLCSAADGVQSKPTVSHIGFEQ